MFQRMLDEVNPRVADILEGALDGREMSVDDAELLLGVEGADQHALLWAADRARQEDVGDDVSYVICRNVNFTNICYVGCSFCGFARHKHQSDAYVHDMDTVLEKCALAVARGATEICLQGGTGFLSLSYLYLTLGKNREPHLRLGFYQILRQRTP